MQHVSGKLTQTNSTGLLDEAFENAIKEAAQTPGAQTPAYEFSDHNEGAPPTRMQFLEEMRDLYRLHHETLDEGIKASLKMLNSPKAKSLNASFEKSMKNGSLQPDEDTVYKSVELANDEAFHPVKVSAFKADISIGIGIALSAILYVGIEAGIEFVYNINAAQKGYRAWGSLAVGKDASASIGINISIWWSEPVQGAISGAFIDLTFMASEIPISVRLSNITERGKIKLDYPFKPSSRKFAGISLRVGIGVATDVPKWPSWPPTTLNDPGPKLIESVVKGGAKYLGYQMLPPPPVSMTIYFTNNITNASNLVIGEVSQFNATLTAPSGGEKGYCQLTKNVTELAITMPSDIFSEDDVVKISVLSISWRQDPSTDYTLNLTYVGDNTTWNSNLVFTIENMSSSTSHPSIGSIKSTMSSSDINWNAQTKIELLKTVYNAVISWQLKNDREYIQTTPPLNDSNVIIAYPNDDNGWFQLTKFTDTRDSTIWNCGVNFFLNDSGIPCIQAVIWEDGTPWNSGIDNKWSSMKITLTTDPQSCITGYYNENDTTLTVTAKLVS